MISVIRKRAIHALFVVIFSLCFKAALTAQIGPATDATAGELITKNLYVFPSVTDPAVPDAYANALQPIAWLSARNLHLNMPDGLKDKYPFLPYATKYQMDQAALRFIEAAPPNTLLVLDLEYEKDDAPKIDAKDLLRWAKISHALRPDLKVTWYAVWWGDASREWTSDEIVHPGNHPNAAPNADQIALANECDVLNYDVGPTGPLWEQRDLDYANALPQLGRRYFKDKPTCFTISAPLWTTHTVPNFTAKLVGVYGDRASRWIIFFQPGQPINKEFMDRVIKMAHP